MGLERLVRILQHVDSNYDIDLFTPIFQAIETVHRRAPLPGALDDPAVDIAAPRDRRPRALSHGRLSPTGRGPSNEGRWLRPAPDPAARGAARAPDPPDPRGLASSRAGPHRGPEPGRRLPRAAARPDKVAEVIRDEEESLPAHPRPRARAVHRAVDEAGKAGRATISAGDAFRLHDTFGLPIDLTRVMAEERGLAVDLDGYEKLMDKARARSRTAGPGEKERMELPRRGHRQAQEDGRRADARRRQVRGPAHRQRGRGHLERARLRRHGGRPMTSAGRGPAPHEPLRRGRRPGRRRGHDRNGRRLPVPGREHRGVRRLRPSHRARHRGHAARRRSGHGVGGPGRAGRRSGPTTRRPTCSTSPCARSSARKRTRRDRWWRPTACGSTSPARHAMSGRADRAHAAPGNEDIEKKAPVFAQVVSLSQARSINGVRAVFGEKYPDPVRVVSIGVRLDEVLVRSRRRALAPALFHRAVRRNAPRRHVGGLALRDRRRAGPRGGRAPDHGADRRRRPGRGGNGPRARAAGSRPPPTWTTTGCPTSSTSSVRLLDESAIPRRAGGRSPPCWNRCASASRRFARHTRPRPGPDWSTRPGASRPRPADRSSWSDCRERSPNDLLSAMDAIRSKHADAAVMLIGADEEASRVSIVARVPEGAGRARGSRPATGSARRPTACGGRGGGRPDMAQAGAKNPQLVPEAIATARAFAEGALG